jgi:hypothetical protein
MSCNFIIEDKEIRGGGHHDSWAIIQRKNNWIPTLLDAILKIQIMRYRVCLLIYLIMIDFEKKFKKGGSIIIWGFRRVLSLRNLLFKYK